MSCPTSFHRPTGPRYRADGLMRCAIRPVACHHHCDRTSPMSPTRQCPYSRSRLAVGALTGQPGEWRESHCPAQLLVQHAFAVPLTHSAMSNRHHHPVRPGPRPHRRDAPRPAALQPS